MEQYIATFHTHLAALRTCNALQKQGISDARLAPVPRRLSSSCGTCVIFPLEPGQSVPEHTDPPVTVEHVYQQGEQGWELIQ